MGVSVLDLSKFVRGSASEKRRFGDAVIESVHQTGFVIFENHGIPTADRDRAVDLMLEAGHLPEEAKAKYVVPGIGFQRGFAPFGTEHAKDNPDHVDLKEFWMFGPELTTSHPMRSFYRENVVPDEVEGFGQAIMRLRSAQENASVPILQAISLGLCMPEHWLPTLAWQGDTTIRPIFYPKISWCRKRLGDRFEGCVRSAPHEDIALLTLLILASSRGLQIQDRQGNWMDVGGEPGHLVVNAGDILQWLTDGFLPSTTHRVVNPEDEETERASFPFFIHPKPTDLLEVPELFWRLKGRTQAPPAAHARTVLHQRLHLINLLDKAVPSDAWLEELVSR